ncbi:MAG: YqeG family HAD IIIA-type phosphatase [Kaiparowitsia implicata GSE-PSE-MK54-09C]|jgi:HAD superfamily phosphatase (TIGR01668 family)|nr:YqeG family HAD IIIA-type phosphatase [Kaiparowitsia implicata GSE-PSE-MK54-09C]
MPRLRNVSDSVSPNRLGQRSLNRIPRAAGAIAQIDLLQLQQAHIRGLILDLDNTIVSEDDRVMSPNAEAWIAEALQMGFQCYLLSNGSRRYRVRYWSERLGLPAFSPARKPFPKGFRTALRAMGLTPTQAIVIGDSRHTDVIGAWWVGCRCIQVASLPHPPRWWEAIAGRWLHHHYPAALSLEPLDVQAALQDYKDGLR